EALVLLRIFFASDSNVLGVEKAYDGGENGLAGDVTQFQVPFHPSTEAWEAPAEFEQPFVFRCIAPFSELQVVTILFAAPGIHPRRLKMPAGIRAEPGVGIGRGQSNRIEAIDLVAVRDTLPVGVEIGPMAAHPPATDSRLCIATVAQQRLHSARLGA